MAGWRKAVAAVAGAALVLASAESAVGQDNLHEQTIVTWPDPATPPHTQTRCVKHAETSGVHCHGLHCSHTTWKTCIGWATDLQIMQCKIRLVVPRPRSLPASAESMARTIAKVCAGVALGTVAITSYESFGSSVAALVPAFNGCVASRGSAAIGSLAMVFHRECGWTGWNHGPQDNSSPDPDEPNDDDSSGQ